MIQRQAPTCRPASLAEQGQQRHKFAAKAQLMTCSATQRNRRLPVEITSIVVSRQLLNLPGYNVLAYITSYSPPEGSGGKAVGACPPHRMHSHKAHSSAPHRSSDLHIEAELYQQSYLRRYPRPPRRRHAVLQREQEPKVLTKGADMQPLPAACLHAQGTL